MKKTAIALVLGALVIAFTLGQHTVRASDVTPRFEHIYSEEVNDGRIDNNLSVYHDKASGAEFICAYDIYQHLAVPQPQSCFLTGRKW